MNKIVFLGSKFIGYKCLEFLVENQHNLNIEIVGVLSNNSSIFGNYNLESFCDQNSIRYLNTLAQIETVDYIISVQYHKILKNEQINKATKLAINLHMAPLPEYRGCNQFSHAIIDQRNYFGTTLHVMDEFIDNGDIIAENRFHIDPKIELKELYDLTVSKSIELFCSEIPNIVNGVYNRTPQNNLVKERGTSIHFRKEINDLKCIDISWSDEKIERYIRATNMPGFEPPYILVNGEKQYIVDDNGKRIQN